MEEFYFDSFEVNSGVHGAKIKFKQSAYIPNDPTSKVVASAFTSLESLKSMVYLLIRHIKQVERENGVSYPIPNNVLNGWKIAPEDWELFWENKK